MWEVYHHVVNKLGLVFQAQWLHVQNKHQHEEKGTCIVMKHTKWINRMILCYK